ncbi:MAG: aminodeoxychorismate synthase component I [Gammaproteobacteria bacterium]|nr:aminodeoxychorismate synthase component I [Gammaproteobacteria bacterium]MCP5425434.1 aminodeoxychorismate synthase component I [Gammaproteobacteria bacterium]MCP5459783.1 aminodeoxychorismate synthase component I [Gammaproteobacteria bacterium]
MDQSNGLAIDAAHGHSNLHFPPGNDSALIYDSRRGRWLSFANPRSIHTVWRIEDVVPTLAMLDEAVRRDGSWAVGFLAYEAAPACDPALTVKAPGACPLLWFGLYDDPLIIPPTTVEEQARAVFPTPLHWKPSISESAYPQAIARIKTYIEAGDTYQINFTFRLHAPFDGDPWPVFLRLSQAQGTPYGAFLNTVDWAICSASPELFFQLDGNRLLSRPMKGTAPRGLWRTDDLQRATQLKSSEKERAENVMIVDMMRNDLGRIAGIGSVQTPRLFEVEQYPTVWQMTSTVGCDTRADLPELLCALFPAASITGAPKRRAMEIIAELETTPRGIYTGSIGFMAPQRYAQFNVAIRTVWIDKSKRQAEYGVGGGIVWDSAAHSEFQECYAKARILSATQPEFCLLETLLWTPERGFWLFDEHLDRLLNSARYFAFSADGEAIQRRLAAAVASAPAHPHKVRLRVARDGNVTVEVLNLPRQQASPRVCLAKQPVDSSNVFLYHKTTHRTIYEQAKRDCPGYDDVLLWNEAGEITESCIANVLFKRAGEWFTPPIHCGLLAGVYRAVLLRQGRLKERVLRIEDWNACDEIRLLNSVRGIWKIHL